MVAGRFVNAYSTNDWMLGVAFRARYGLFTSVVLILKKSTAAAAICLMVSRISSLSALTFDLPMSASLSYDFCYFFSTVSLLKAWLEFNQLRFLVLRM